MQVVQKEAYPSIWRLFRIWSGIGLQSFGGGASTLFLIRREFVEKHAWVDSEEILRYWNLCLFTPGINLIALTVLIGRKLGGPWGIVVSLAGMLLPSAAITCLLAAGFQIVQHVPAIQAILRGVIPATAGVMLFVGVGFAEPLLKLVTKEGVWRALISLFVVVYCFVALIVFKLSVIVVLLSAALIGAVCFTDWRKPKEAEHGDEE
jgi:chromate transporter